MSYATWKPIATCGPPPQYKNVLVINGNDKKTIRVRFWQRYGSPSALFWTDKGITHNSKSAEPFDFYTHWDDLPEPPT